MLNRNERHIAMPGPQPFEIGFLKYLLLEQAEATVKELLLFLVSHHTKLQSAFPDEQSSSLTSISMRCSR